MKSAEETKRQVIRCRAIEVQVQFFLSVKHSLTSGTFHPDESSTGSPFLRETLGGRKLLRRVLSERPLSAGGEVGNRIYRSRGALRVVRITKIRPRGRDGGRKGVRDLPVEQPP